MTKQHFAGKQLRKYRDSTAGLTVAEINALDGLSDELALLDGVTATAAEINRAADISANAAVSATGVTLAVTAALHAGKVITFGKADGTACTLPAATGTGNIYRFVVGTTATSVGNVIKVANATDVMNGSMILQQDVDSAGSLKLWAAADGDDTVTLAGAATTGGPKGSYIECIDYVTGFWHVHGWTKSGGGSEATPFSATVGS